MEIFSREETIRRFEVLIRHLETNVKMEEFNFGVFWEEVDCGTIGCAMGHACHIPEFKELGLRLRRGFVNNVIDISFEGRLGFDAASGFFNISWRDANFCFNPGHPFEIGRDSRSNELLNGNDQYNLDLRAPLVKASPIEVANHLRKYLKLRFSHEMKMEIPA